MNLEAMQTLCTEYTRLKKRDQKFAKSLIDQYAVKGKLTEKQWVWVEKLADEIDYAGVPDFTKDVA